MRRIHPRATCDRDGRGGQRRPAAIILAVLFGLAACAPIKQSEPSKAPASPNPPVATEKLAPVALAPGMTGNPTVSPAAKSSASPAVASPAKPSASPAVATAPAAASPAAAAPAAPTPTTVVAAPPTPPAPPAPPGVSCPLGTIGMWGQPDIIGTPVYICRQLNPPR